MHLWEAFVVKCLVPCLLLCSHSLVSCLSLSPSSGGKTCCAACTHCMCAWNSQEINTINTLIANFRLRYFFFTKFRRRHWDKRCSQTHLQCVSPVQELSLTCVRERETEMKAINTLMTLGNTAAKFTSPQSNSTSSTAAGYAPRRTLNLFSHFGQRFFPSL